MRVKLEYGRHGLDVELPADNVAAVLEARPLTPLSDPERALEDALAQPIGTPPLAELARGRRDACILVCDITRPVPNTLILRHVMAALHQAGMRREQIHVLVATGMHRPNEGDELLELLGAEIVNNYRVENHFGQERDQHTFLGNTPNQVPVYIDSRYIQADLKITTGLIEPHFWAGFSGGRKVICPGIAGIDTVRAWHSPRFIEHPRAAPGNIEGNPVHEENTHIALMSGCDFIVNVCIDSVRRVTAVVAGDMIAAWEKGVQACRRQVVVPVNHAVDVVVTSCAGYPLDTTFYQSVKGMTGAVPIVRRGGTIIVAASMTEGVGSSEFRRLIQETDSLESFFTRIQDSSFFVMDQWQLEELAKVRRHCNVKVFSEGLSAESLARCFVEPIPSVEAGIADALRDHGATASIAVIPDGPYVLPTLVI